MSGGTGGKSLSPHSTKQRACPMTRQTRGKRLSLRPIIRRTGGKRPGTSGERPGMSGERSDGSSERPDTSAEGSDGPSKPLCASRETPEASEQTPVRAGEVAGTAGEESGTSGRLMDGGPEDVEYDRREETQALCFVCAALQEIRSGPENGQALPDRESGAKRTSESAGVPPTR